MFYWLKNKRALEELNKKKWFRWLSCMNTNVAKDEELKVQKLTYKGSLTELYKKDIHRYAEYNLVDVKVVVELDKKYDFIHLHFWIISYIAFWRCIRRIHF